MKIFNFLKEMWGNPKGKALVLLWIYFTFFVVIISVVRSNYNPNLEFPKVPEIPSLELTSLEKYAKFNNYRSKYIRGDMVIESSLYENSKIITIDNKSYYYKDKLYEQTDDKYIISSYQIDPLYLITSPENIKLLIDKGKLKSKSEDYELGFNLTTYFVKISELKILLNEDVNIEEEFTIKLYEKENRVIKVEIDLVNYMNVENDKIEINYSQIGEIKPFDIVIEEL